MKRDFDILIPGHYFCDVIFTKMQDFPSLGTEIYSEGVKVVAGGGAINTSIGLHRLGIDVGWIGMLGTDFFSQYVKGYIEQEGLDAGLVTYVDMPFERVTVALSYPSERAFVTYVQKPPELIDMVADAIKTINFRHLHLPSLIVHDDMPALLSACKAKGIGVSMDCQQREETLEMPLVRAILEAVDIFMPNALEAQRVTGTSNLDAAMATLSQISNGVVIKNGADGVLAQFGENKYDAPAFAVTPLDTTGAGDSFNAGFLAAYLKHLPIETCLQWGNYCGAQSTLGYGASNAPYSVPTEAPLI